MRELLGGKGANLAEMNLVGIPVPPGFTITTEVCTEYYQHGKEEIIKMIKPEVEAAMKGVEKNMGMEFGSSSNPLLLSVRSGARASMPGMMDTILNLGLNDEAVEGLAKKTGNARFAWDSYRRFVQMYGDVVLDMKPQSKEDVDHRRDQGREESQERYRADDRRPEGTGRTLQGRDQEKHGQGLPDQSVGTALGRYLRRIQQLDERARHPVPQAEQHPRRMGNGRERTGDGVR